MEIVDLEYSSAFICLSFFSYNISDLVNKNVFLRQSIDSLCTHKPSIVHVWKTIAYSVVHIYQRTNAFGLHVRRYQRQCTISWRTCSGLQTASPGP
jgi:hypothetical protein